MFVEQLTKNDIRKLIIKLGFGRYIWHEFNNELGLLEIGVRIKIIFGDKMDPRCPWIDETIGFSDYGCEMVLIGEELKIYRKMALEWLISKESDASCTGVQ